MVHTNDTEVKSMMYMGDPVRAAAWLYYAADRTQSEVAEEIGVSRQTVANYLSEARERGYVTILLAPDILERNRLAEELSETYSLEGVHVVPAFGGGDEEQRRAVGRAGGEVLCALADDSAVIGVSSGRTVSALARTLPKRHLPDATIIQVSGSSIDAAEHSPEVCASTVASKLSARCLNLHAPAYVSTKDLAESLKREPALSWHFERVANADILLFGIGELSTTTDLEQPPYVNADVRDQYIAAGAVGIAFDRFFGADGTEVDGPLTTRSMAIDIRVAEKIPVRLAVCSGLMKRQAVYAALGAGLVTHLILDAALAHALCMGSGNNGN
ncbi:MAG: winged helix-turn-helix transcriptional regulator [Hyphomicrobiales bacterium]|nr:winged helix-turn-helix transcriptional regulator [Hyphomicrobiales bacterium]